MVILPRNGYQKLTFSPGINHVQYERGRAVQARMCSTYQSHLLYKQRCIVRIRNIMSTRQDVQYGQGTSLVYARMCSTGKAYHQYKRRCEVQARHIFSTSEVNHQLLYRKKCFPINESLLLLIHQVKTVSTL